MKDGTDAVADWAILNALVNTAAGATWVSFHHGGGVGIGYSLHAGMVVVADGTAARGALPRARADQRSGHGRDPPRRRRLRRGDPRGRGARRRDPAASAARIARMTADLVLRHARVMTCDPARPGLGMIEHGAIAIEGGRIAWVGPAAEAARRDPGRRRSAAGWSPRARRLPHPRDLRRRSRERVRDARGGQELPRDRGGGRRHRGDARADARRLRRGAARAARRPGSTPRSPRGTTTIEVKSGYDLTVAGELRLLRCIARGAPARRRRGSCRRCSPTSCRPSARAIARPTSRELCERADPAGRDASGSRPRSTSTATRARSRSPRRARSSGRREAPGSRCAATSASSPISARPSCSPSSARCRAITSSRSPTRGSRRSPRAGVVAVMLPGACVQLRLPVPPVERLRAAGVAMAIASDLNPGSSFCESCRSRCGSRPPTRDDRRGGVARRHPPRGDRARAAGRGHARGRARRPIWSSGGATSRRRFRTATGRRPP